MFQNPEYNLYQTECEIKLFKKHFQSYGKLKFNFHFDRKESSVTSYHMRYTYSKIYFESKMLVTLGIRSAKINLKSFK